MYFLHYDDPTFERHGGIYVPYNTEAEARHQAAADMRWVGNDPVAARLAGLFEAEYGGHERIAVDDMNVHVAQGWQYDYNQPYGHLDLAQRRKVATPAQLAHGAAKLQRAQDELALRGHEEWLLGIHRARADGTLYEANQPGSAWSVMTGGTATGGAVGLVAATAKTVVMLIAGASDQPNLTLTMLAFDGVTASAIPVLVEYVSSTQAGAGTNTTGVLKQVRGWPAMAPQTTSAVNYTAEPTVLEVYRKLLLTPNGGLLVLPEPLGREPTGVVTAVTQFKAMGVRLTAPAAVNCHATQEFEE